MQLKWYKFMLIIAGSWFVMTIYSAFYLDINHEHKAQLIGVNKYLVLYDSGFYSLKDGKNIESFVYGTNSTINKTYVVATNGIYILENKITHMSISYYPNQYKNLTEHSIKLKKIFSDSSDRFEVISSLSNLDKQYIRSAVRNGRPILDESKLISSDAKWMIELLGR